MPYRRKNAYFVERVLLFLLREVRELHLLQCVDLPILDTLHSINHAVGALTCITSAIPNFYRSVKRLELIIYYHGGLRP
jgi:hypothetical protein